MRYILHVALHAAVFALVYYVARAHGLHGEMPYVVAALATGLLAHLLYSHRYRGVFHRRRW